VPDLDGRGALLSLDVLSPRGQLTREQEERAIALFERRYPGFTFARTPKDQPAILDGVIVRSGIIVALVETKCRELLLDTFRGYGWRAILTASKLDAGMRAAREWRVPFVFWFYSAAEDWLLVQRVCNPDGTAVIDIERRRSRTQQTCNGGSIVRENAYLDLSRANLLRGERA